MTRQPVKSGFFVCQGIIIKINVCKNNNSIIKCTCRRGDGCLAGASLPALSNLTMLGLKQMNNKKIRLLQAALIELGLDYDEAFERACLIYMEIRVSSYIKKTGGV